MIARTAICCLSPAGIALSMMLRNANTGTSARIAAARIATRNTMIVALYGRANVQTRRTVPSCNSTPFKESLSPGIIE